MKKKVKNIIISVIVFIVCVLLNYVFTDLGFKEEPMYISGIPFWLGSIIMCLLLPICFYFGLKDEK